MARSKRASPKRAGSAVAGVPEALARAKRKATQRFLSEPHPYPQASRRFVSPHPVHNVVGVGIGPKIAGGKETKTMCVRLYVRDKLPNACVGKKHALPKRIDGMPVDVIEVGSPRVLNHCGAPRIRPARPGCCIAAAGQSSICPEYPGTMGAVVEDEDGKLYILSNNHVLSVEEIFPIGTPIVQPTGPPKANRIAELTAVISFKPSLRTEVDCALARVTSPKAVKGVPLPPVGPLSSATVIQPAVGMKVEKIGITTGHRTGKITDIDADFQVEYDFTGTVFLENQIQIAHGPKPFCDRGDSGSLVVDTASKQATGLLAVNMTGFALANHLSVVLTKLSVCLGSSLKLKIA